MIKLNHLPDNIMDIIMDVSRECGVKPDKVIKSMLGLVSKNDAKRAVYEEEKGCKKPAKTEETQG